MCASMKKKLKERKTESFLEIQRERPKDRIIKIYLAKHQLIFVTKAQNYYVPLFMCPMKSTTWPLSCKELKFVLYKYFQNPSAGGFHYSDPQ